MKKGRGKSTGLLPNSFRIISSCIKTVSTSASTVVRSAGASVAASISAAADDRRDQVIWAGFDRLELGPASFRHVLLLAYHNGFQVIDVEDASNFTELVSKRDGPVTFLQMLPRPLKTDGNEKLTSLHPLLVIVAGDEATRSTMVQNHSYLIAPGMNGSVGSQSGTFANSPTAVRFYSLQSNCYVKVLRFRSPVFLVRCSPLLVAVGLEKEIHCIDAATLEDRFTIPTYPVPQFGGQGTIGVNFGYGPLAVGPRWLAYASNSLLVSNTNRLSPKNLGTPGITPSTSPNNGTLMARYAMESSKQLAAGIINLSDKGYKTLSKYRPEILPDRPNSPTLSNSGWKARTASETDYAGMVVVKDVVSEAVISQFRAHTSPLSALCFDPSGTLLVTASIHGNNINIFRIMPCTVSGSSNQSHDWSSSHVLLYKLHRGITSAVIQDISFGNYSQWISIVSSKGTCHIFALSPFGGDASVHAHGFHMPATNPVLSLPWWSTPSFVIDQQPSPPPPPLTLSVVSRLKSNSFGFLNSVSNGASSLVGNVHIPCGAVASVFHNSMSRNFKGVPPRFHSMEHLLIYSPSGYVIQYELVPSIDIQQIDVSTETQSGSCQQIQDEELRLIFKSHQWWEVCRKSDSPEREECISMAYVNGQESATSIYSGRSNDCLGVQKLEKSDSFKKNDRSHWFLSNVEVQINSGRLPVWQNTKVCFFVMSPANVNDFAGGESEIEKIRFHEVEIRRKDLVPVFDHVNSIKSSWSDRAYSIGKNHFASSSEVGRFREVSDETVICHSNPASLSSTESSDGGSSRRIENLLELDPVNFEKPTTTISHKQAEDSEHYNPPSHVDSISSRMMEDPLLTTDYLDSSVEVAKELSSASCCNEKKIVDEGCFQEGYCKMVEPDGCYSLTTIVVDASENNIENDRGREAISEENHGEDDVFLGGMFD